MVTHYTVASGQVACGRNNHDLTATSNRDQVTCKTCLRSEKFTVTESPASSRWECGKTSVALTAVKEMTRPKGMWREYWTAHIRSISPLNKLPRGFKEPKPLLSIDARK